MGKVLIMTASTGQGHNQVARVLAGELTAQDCQVVILDVFGQNKAFLRMVVIDAYNRIAISSSRLNGILYHSSNEETSFRRLSRLIYRLLHKNVRDYVAQAEADLIIVTHPLLVGVLGELKRRGSFHVPVLSVITDFDVHRSYAHPEIEAYVTACEETSAILQSMGIPRSKIFINGIPVRRDFQARANNDIPFKPFTILLMGGSMGVKPMMKVLAILLETQVPMRLVVVCGTNHKLRRQMEKRYLPRVPAHINLEVLGFTQHIPELMDEADMLLSKPGGITTSEAINKQIPLMVPFLIPGVEESNCRILEEAGLVLRVDRLDDIPALIESVYSDRSLLLNISDNMQLFSQDFSIDHTLSICWNLMNCYGGAHEQ